MHIISRIFVPPRQSYFLFGPRGTGKSTLIKKLYPGALKLDFLLPDLERSYIANPERIIEVLLARQNNIKRQPSDQSNIVVIDEVQRVPKILAAIHAIIENKDFDWQFVLTGSSARKLKMQGIDLLAGRVLKCSLYPFVASELQDDFCLENILQYGSLPLLYNASDRSKTLQTYISLYLKEEIQQEGLVRNLENFTRFLEVISFSHATTLNVSNIARECAVKRKTVESYINILEDLLLCFKITIFSKRAKRELSNHPKFYLFDCGVFRTLRPKGVLDRNEEIEGAALEGLVAANLLAWSEYSNNNTNIYFWRTRSGVEVDFIVYGENIFWAIEVKNSKKFNKQDLKSLENFLQDYPMSCGIFLYRGSEEIMINNILCMPCEKFLLSLKINQTPQYNNHD